jgi:DNA-directed RNA polymerase specialized sigma24 family protein
VQGAGASGLTTEERRAAVVALYREHRPALLRYARLLSSDDAEAEALVRSACVRYYASWDGRDHDGIDDALLAELLDAARKRKPRVRAEADPVQRALARLSPRQRETVVLRLYGGCTEKQISRLIGCAIGSVRTHWRRGINELIGALGDDVEAMQ